MELNETEYFKFVQWLRDKGEELSFTTSEVAFAKQIFAFMEDYGSFKKKMSELGNKDNVFSKISSFCKEKYK